MAKRLANEDDLKRIERDRKEINDAYDNVTTKLIKLKLD